MIGAHIDSWDVGQGAHDDGQGVVAAWEAVRLIASQSELRPRRSIRLVCFTDEECKSSGAKAYLQQTMDEVRAGRVVAAIETDVGCGRPIGFGFTGQAAAKQQLADMTAQFGQWGWDAVCDEPSGGVDVRPLLGLGRAGDCCCGWKRAGGRQSTSAITTRSLDTIEKIDPLLLTSHVRLLAMMTWLLAEADDRLPSDIWPSNHLL